MDDERPPRPRPARSRRPAPRPQAAPRPRADYGDDTRDQPYRTHTRRRDRQRSTIRPLHVLLLAILVIGLIAFTTKVLTGGDEAGGSSATTAMAASTVGASSAGQQPKTAKAESASATTKATTDAIGQPLAPLVEGRPAPTYMAGAKASANQPGLAAASYVALDVNKNQIVLAYDDAHQRPIASLTKMMTGLLTSEAGNLAHMVVVSPTAAGVEPNKDGLIIGNRYPRGVLLYSALLASNNDAAAALGEDLGSGNYQRYYKMMNKRAKELGLTRTKYGSASGLNDVANYSTALDQAIMLARALENPTFAKTVDTWQHTVHWADTGGTHTYTNHDKMLTTFPGTIGGKTGFTTLAGGCLAVAVRRGGRTMVGVVLHSNDIWGDMPKLIDAAFKRAS